MGAVHFSIDIALVSELKRHLPLEVFVETGTFKGATVEQIQPFFDELHTVEASPQYFSESLKRFRDDSKVHVHSGDSVAFLKQHSTRLRKRTVLFWLDAHWCGEESAGEESQSPLLGELEAIGHLAPQSVLLIDDARLYLAPPTAPHCADQWPDFDDIVRCLTSLSSRHRLMVLNDVFLLYPEAIHQDLRNYASQAGVDWLGVFHKSHEHDRLFHQLNEKHAEIERLLKVSQERDLEIQKLTMIAEERLKATADQLNEKHAEIERLLKVSQERDLEIQKLTVVAEERLKVIVHQHEQAQTLQKDLNDLRK